jgi:hypothetical protein
MRKGLLFKNPELQKLYRLFYEFSEGLRYPNCENTRDEIQLAERFEERLIKEGFIHDPTGESS